MFDIGLQELVLIFVIALLVFGPKNLPQLGKSLGGAMREFRKASDELRPTIETALKINEIDPVPDLTPITTPPEAVPVPTAEAPPDSAPHPYDTPAAPVSDGAPFPLTDGRPCLARRAGKLFHGRDCSWARRIREPERVYFKRVAEAREAGY